MRDEELRLWSDADLREYVLSGTAEDWAEIKRRFTREQLEELKLALFPPPVPTAEQAAALIERIASTTSEDWLRQLCVKAAGWDVAIRGAIDARLAELRRMEPQRPYFFQPVDRGWVSPPVDRAPPDRPQAVSAPAPRPAGSDSGPTVKPGPYSWMR